MPTADTPATAEHARLAEATGRAEDDLFSANPWYEWGPYLSERAWGTVREDYSESGDAWDSFPHDHARSRAYRWNEDGMAGISDIRHELCLALALWNGEDPILKERMFGLTGPQGNHGEDVKEYWWYLEGLPSHALLQLALPLPAGRVPLRRSSSTTAAACSDPELELLDTGVFDDDRYWSVDVTYAKASPTEVLAADRGREPRRRTRRRSTCCRRCGSATRGRGATRRRARGSRATARRSWSPTTRSPATGSRRRPAPTARCPRRSSARTRRTRRASSGRTPTTPYPKDGINDHVVSGAATVNPDGFGTKAALRYRADRAGRRHGRAAAAAAPAGRRGRRRRPTGRAAPFDATVAAREADADEFYARARARRAPTPEQMRVLRQACAGLVWSKQIYPYDVRRWLDGDPGEPPPPEARQHGRNSGWRHLDSFDVLAMPDPWEYPWFAAWDLGVPRGPVGAPRPGVREVPAPRAAARVVPAPERRAARVRVELRRRQPAGARDGGAPRLPDRRRPRPRVPRAHLPEAAASTSPGGSTARTPTATTSSAAASSASTTSARSTAPTSREGVALEQADGTAWMAYYALSMLVIAIELAEENDVYEDMVIKFLEQFVLIARALEAAGPLRRRRRVLLRPARLPVRRQRRR